jgi:hypothetical protein
MAENKTGLFVEAQQAEQRGNKVGRDLWDRYAGHRAQVTAAILALAPPAGADVGVAKATGRVCLLGAGNANDLDLARLAARYDEVHLVDIDPAALSRAVSRPDREARAKLRCHAPVDLSGLFRQIDSGRARTASPEALLASGTAEVLGQLPGPFDVVVSGCVLSQMSWALAQKAERDPNALPAPLPTLEQALLTIHLRTMLGLVKPTGTALLVADLVSSESWPIDELAPDTDLAALVQHLSEERLAFTVCNPALIKQILRRDPVLAAGLAPPELGAPWLWTGSKDLTYLVYPMKLRRRAA